METLDAPPSVAPDNQSVIFTLSTHGREVECSVSRDALEQHFWVQPGASDKRILTAFADGRKRIMAIAERKILAHSSERIVLTAVDFEART
ncbi:DUF1488 domain-containing protein [Trinickia violacea]|uniref:DUF1488 domain-containing protein n=1 Tax=Trinickia violacea TaxID=2571746 RepID=A0A4V1EI39_9BURK|nr:DUF1488 domain-containing protein [Trinickia violacea]QCP52430.1 DUF1488 domain-containing protein [Trinickia violacea]